MFQIGIWGILDFQGYRDYNEDMYEKEGVFEKYPFE